MWYPCVNVAFGASNPVFLRCNSSPSWPRSRKLRLPAAQPSRTLQAGPGDHIYMYIETLYIHICIYYLYAYILIHFYINIHK